MQIACAWQGMDSEMLVELSHCVAKAVKDAELVACWNHVDITNLLGLN